MNTKAVLNLIFVVCVTICGIYIPCTLAATSPITGESHREGKQWGGFGLGGLGGYGGIGQYGGYGSRRGGGTNLGANGVNRGFGGMMNTCIGCVSLR